MKTRLSYAPIAKAGTALLATLLMAACQATTTVDPELSVGTHRHGYVMPIGGALSEDNEAIYSRIIAASKDGEVGILPTATAEQPPGASSRRRFLGFEAKPEVIMVTEANKEAAADPAIAEQIRSFHAIFFTGGDQARILAAFRPETGDTVGYKALWDVLDRGGLIAGTSAGAAMMSDPIIGGGTSRSALENGVAPPGDDDARGVIVTRGMGFFPYGITDQHFLARGRLGRLVVALSHTGTRLGWGIDEDSAVLADLSTNKVVTWGNDRALVLVDMKQASKEGKGYRNVRISILGGGDWVDGPSGEVTPAEGKKPLSADPAKTEAIPVAKDAWDDYVISDLAEQLALSTQTTAKALDPNFEIVLSEDDGTRLYIGPDNDPDTISVVNLRMDILPRANAAP
ncbi:cyanophycinase [bacterium]|nr:cyanophycinase [bacterium]